MSELTLKQMDKKRIKEQRLDSQSRAIFPKRGKKNK